MIESPIFLTAAVWPVIFAIYGLYDLRRPTHATAELQRLFNGVLMSVLLVVLITFIGEHRHLAQLRRLARSASAL